jgi:hypothetical protein
LEQPPFPEPTTDDPRPGLRGETTWQFLHRSTWERARETRAFYNAALGELPAESRGPLLSGHSAGKTESVLLELLVGRFLQLRGAVQLEHEPEINGRHVDWRATFPDGSIHVEAMMPVYNAGSAETMRRHERLLGVVEQLIPYGWWVLPFHLPPLAGDASLRAFRSVVHGLLRGLPPLSSVSRETTLRLAGRVPQGRVELTAVPANGRGGLGGGAVVAQFDNSQVVLRNAWNNSRKRKQGRSVPSPALLALAGSFIGADLDDFEQALLGGGFVPDGVMANERKPPWAGVLAFPSISPASAADPVLFVAPGYGGPFPLTIERLEVRRIISGEVVVQPAHDVNVMAGVRWAKRPLGDE